jgi:hypothetical protein
LARPNPAAATTTNQETKKQARKIYRTEQVDIDRSPKIPAACGQASYWLNPLKLISLHDGMRAGCCASFTLPSSQGGFSKNGAIPRSMNMNMNRRQRMLTTKRKRTTKSPQHLRRPLYYASLMMLPHFVENTLFQGSIALLAAMGKSRCLHPRCLLHAMIQSMHSVSYDLIPTDVVGHAEQDPATWMDPVEDCLEQIGKELLKNQ